MVLRTGERSNLFTKVVIANEERVKQSRGIVTIYMWRSVILNGAQRNEESLSSVAALEEILRCAQNDKAGLMSIY